MSISIKIENFEGPFDLLLHLIKKNEMEIYDIKILEITNQYIGFLNTMQEMDLEVTSEFIVLASTLLEIKSKELLPNTSVKQKDGDEKEVSKEELIEKLVQYRKFKEAAMFLRNREIEEGVMYSKRPEIIEDKKKPLDLNELLKNTSLLDLYNLFNQVLTNYYNKQNTNGKIPKQISIDRFKIEDKMDSLTKYFKYKPNSTFSEVIFNCESKIEVIVTFLAMLELIKLKKVKIVQEDNFNEIYMEGV